MREESVRVEGENPLRGAEQPLRGEARSLQISTPQSQGARGGGGESVDHALESPHV